MRRRGPKRVYFIRPIGMDGPVKIGCSVSPDGRRVTLEAWSPFPLEIIAEIEGDLTTEGRFHALFAKHHANREWFNWSPKMAEVVASINAGTFDAATLPEPILAANLYRKPRTPLQRRQQSFSLREAWLSKRAGTRFKGDVYGIAYRDDRAELESFERYCADPIGEGRHIDAPWAAKRRAEYSARRRKAAA